MVRKLVTIRKVLELEPIPGADFIELAHVGGWQCVVKKGEVKENDLVLYFEIDSFLPIRPEFEFLRQSSFKKMGDEEGFRLKTIRLRKKISQGLVLPLSTFPEIDFSDTKKDYAEELGVKKYEPPISPTMQAVVKGIFPTHIIRKTDEERIQNIPEILDTDEMFIVTEKMDGTSFTAFNHNEDDGVCSRNLLLKESDNIYFQMDTKYNIRKQLKEHNLNFAVQGEIIGEGIQKNLYKIKGHDLLVFNIFDIDNQTYLSWQDVIKYCDLLGFNRVADLETVNLKNTFKDVDSILEYCEGKSYLCPTQEREGLVFKSLSDPNVSFKVINNKWLLKNE